MAEVLRSGAYSDEVVTNLVRRRFTAVMYDVAPPGENYGDAFAYDEVATKVIGPIEDLYRGPLSNAMQDEDGRVHADSYPAALFVLPDGTKLGPGLWGIVPPEVMLRELQQVMAKWPEHFAPSAAEQAVFAASKARRDDPSAQLEAARLHWELAEFEAVLACTEGLARAVGTAAAAQRAEAGYLRGRALQCLGRDADARSELQAARESCELPAGELPPAIEVAIARLDMRAGKDADALARLLPLTRLGSPTKWTGAAMYYAGLCHHRLGDEAAAKSIWRRHREQMPFDRLARRSAASLGLPEAEAFTNQELIDKTGWW